MSEASPDDGLLPWLADHERALADDLLRWIAIPSVAGKPDRREALAWSAAEVAAGCRTAGFPVVETWPQGESHAVFAEWTTDAALPTVLVYTHHDVRATDGEQWTETEPFTPVEREGRIFGRGASDAKGQVLAHLWGLRAHLGATGRSTPAVNLKLLIEGEEELGSPHLAELLETRRARLDCDLVVFSDTALLDAEHPAVCLGIRGMVGATLTVFGPEGDVHSGAVSGAAPNPILDLAGLVAQLHDDRGRITLPGHYDDVLTPDARERADWAALPFDEERWLADAGTSRVVGEAGFTIPERLWGRPSLEVITIRAGDVEGLPRAVIPASATAELSVRLVDRQHPQRVAEQLDQWLAERMPRDRWRLEVSHHTAGAPYRTPPDHPAVAALAEAMAVGFDVPVAEVGRMANAGGGPADLLTRTLRAPIVFFGTGLVEDRWHAPDERVRLDVLRRGAATLAAFWPRLAEVL